MCPSLSTSEHKASKEAGMGLGKHPAVGSPRTSRLLESLRALRVGSRASQPLKAPRPLWGSAPSAHGARGHYEHAGPCRGFECRPATRAASPAAVDRKIYCVVQRAVCREIDLDPRKFKSIACLAHIQADKSGKKQLLKNYFDSLCNKIQEYKYGEIPLIEALEYTLQNMDSKVFGEDPSTLIHLGNRPLSQN